MKKRVLSVVLCLALCLCAMVLTVSAEAPCAGQATGHNPDLYSIWGADYTVCGGGFEVDYHFCDLCGIECDDAGNLLTPTAGNGAHDLSDLWDADYTVCDGGFEVDHYYCYECGDRFDENDIK